MPLEPPSSSESHGQPSISISSEDTLLLLNRAMLVTHAVRGAAHELNNVLQMISGSAELLELNPECPPALLPKLQAIGTHTGRGCELVGAVADLARSQPPRAHVADVGKAIERVRRLRRFEQSRGSIEMRVEVPEGSPLTVRVDPMDLQLMLLNLIINAEQAVATAAAKGIDVSVARDGEVCRIAIADSGGGVVLDLESVALTTTRSPQVAAGLGLAATRVLAKRHGGQVVLQQRATGVEAVLMLPVAAA